MELAQRRHGGSRSIWARHLAVQQPSPPPFFVPIAATLGIGIDDCEGEREPPREGWFTLPILGRCKSGEEGCGFIHCLASLLLVLIFLVIELFGG